MKISIELSEQDIRKIIADHLSREWAVTFYPDQLPIQAKRKQNYHAEWEEAAIRINTTVTPSRKDAF
jgi:hypothetical protein